MLIGITLKEYTTFIKETTFDFKATNYKILQDTNVYNKVLKGALFVGENASGKTQVLKAIKFLMDLLFGDKEINYIRMKSMYTKGATFSLSYNFLIDDHDIKYDLKFLENDISSEKLYLDDKLMLERIEDKGRVYFAEERNVIVNKHISLLKQEYYKTRLDNNIILNKWLSFLRNSVYINCLDKEIVYYNALNINDVLLTDYIKEHGSKTINDFVNKLGYNSEIHLDSNFINEDKSIKINTSEEVIAIRKKGTNVYLPLDLESAGNKVFVNLLLPIIHCSKNEGMLIIDEFSSGLHNELEESLIKFFFNNSKGSQLFFASHSTNILDNFILRPDQIYSFSFDAKKGTIIKRFSEENPRESQNLEKMYLNGVFNGLPNYNKKFKF